MKTNWQTKKLGEICELQKIKNIKKDLPYIGLEDIESNTGKFIGSLMPKIVKSLTFYFNSEHILYGRLRPYLNKVLIPGFEGHCSTEIFPIKVRNNLDKKFLHHWLSYDEVVKKINNTCTGARMPRANMKDVLNFPIPLPPLTEQHRIVKILDEVFADVAKAKVNAEKNLQNSKELFESYLQSFFANPGKDWEEKKLKEIGITQTGTTPKTAEKENYGNFIPFIKPADVDFSGVGDIRYDNDGLSEIGLKKGRKMEKGSILMVCIGATIGKVGFAERLVSSNQQINTLTVKDDLEPKFIYYAMTSKEFQGKVLSEGKGAQATLPIINKSKWENLTISYPFSKIKQKSIVSKLDSLSAETRKLETIYRQKLTGLEELKESVLKRAFNGDL